MSRGVLAVLVCVAVCTAQDCKWGSFFSDSSNKCQSEGAGPVDCDKLKDNVESVTIDCDSGKQLVGYKKYSCIDGQIVPKVASSSCQPIDSPTCPSPRGKDSANMIFIQDNLHSFNVLATGQEFHVQCKPGFMFRSSVAGDVLAKCVVKQNGKSKFEITTDAAKDGCLSACAVQDKDKLPQNIENLDMINIVYPSDRKQVADGSELYATVRCAGDHSPINMQSDNAIALKCSSEGKNGPYAGYFVQDCETSACFACAKNCEVPKIEGGDVYKRAGGKVLEKGAKVIPTGSMTAYVVCNEGEDVVGNRYLSCKDGALNSTIPTCSDTTGKIICSPTLVVNGMALPDRSYTVQSDYEVTCNPGYTLAVNSADNIRCSVGPNDNEVSYSESPVCYMGCGIPQIANGNIAYDEAKQIADDTAPYATNETVTVLCTGEYLRMGENPGLCGVSGWTKMPRCVTEEEMTEVGKSTDNDNSAKSISAGLLAVVIAVLTVTAL